MDRLPFKLKHISGWLCLLLAASQAGCGDEVTSPPDMNRTSLACDAGQERRRSARLTQIRLGRSAATAGRNSQILRYSAPARAGH